MALTFDPDKFSSISAVPVALQDRDLYVKFSAMLDFIVDNWAGQFQSDVANKVTDPGRLSPAAVEARITELGYAYIASVMETITNIQFNTLLQFVALINQLKGSRIGLEIVLILLGLDGTIKEWWEQNPKGEPWTYQIVVILNGATVTDIFTTLDRVQSFAKAYVYPIMDNIDFRYNVNFGERPITMGGFWRATYDGTILARI